MKASLAAGLASTTRLAVDRERTMEFAAGRARAYATPMLVRDLDTACRSLLLPHLDPGEDSIATRVELDHLATTPIGMPIELTATVVVVSGRAITFEVSARDSVDLICRGRLCRLIVDVERSEARLGAKAQKAGIA
jgi:predicted thioesterase